MAGFSLAAAQARLIELLQALTGPGGDLENVGVSFSFNARNTMESFREYMYLGQGGGPVSFASLGRNTGGRIRRESQPMTQLHIVVDRPGEETCVNTHARCEELGNVVGNLLASNFDMNGLDGLKWAKVVNFDLDGATDDEGAESVLTLDIEFNCYHT